MLFKLNVPNQAKIQEISLLGKSTSLESVKVDDDKKGLIGAKES